MATRDIITDLVDLTHPLPEDPGEFADDDEATGWSALCEEAAEDREAYEQGLRLTWEHEDDYDPLLGEIAAARNAMLAAEARMRLLIAYGREFTRPRPYRLEDLARAAGMSISGIPHRLRRRRDRRSGPADRGQARPPPRRSTVTGRHRHPAAGATPRGPPWWYTPRLATSRWSHRPRLADWPASTSRTAPGCGAAYPGPFRARPAARHRAGPPRPARDGTAASQRADAA